MWGTMAKISFPIRNLKFRQAQRLLMATVPASLLLAGCATDNQKTMNERPDVMAGIETQPTTFDDFSIAQQMAACSLFLENSAARGIYLSSARAAPTATSTKDVAISSSPEDDLKQAIELELGGYHAEARKLYLWLTAANPNSTFTMPCGNGVNLSSKIVRLAQQRLAAMDVSNPELAKSDEIDEKVEMAKVAPGPTMPNPPKVKRNTDFYLTAGPVDVMPEDDNPPAPPFAIEVSPNTETLARVTPPKEPVSITSEKAVGISDITTSQPPKKSPAAEILELTGGVGAASVRNAGLQPNSTPTEDGNLQSMPAAPTVAETEPMPAPAPVPDDMVPGADEAKPAAMKPAKAETATATATAQDMAPAKPATDDKPLKPAQPEMTTTAERQGPPAPEAVAPVKTTGNAIAKAGQPYYALQLAAYRSREMAEASWVKLQKKSGGLLDGIDHEVRTLAIKGKGLYFRLMTGHFADKAVAAQVCQGFKENSLDCIVRYIEP
ncbi:hypothetical protein CSC3H3_08925 [Thalassospira marina]|uniref:SPOR domain-containing protein n=2 Tax=Thalassospira marina TaxID=2048283 RepID=A0ABM6Q8G6_9PROT|nr:hypothetical protein CSC3H3_08925 [Thalassospira marina]